jgi:hypothetical protein
MAIWSGKSRGLWVDGNVLITKEQLVGKDFLIAKRGDKFTANVQVAYDSKVPLIFFYENDPELLINSGLDPESWNDLHNPCLQEMLKDIYSGTSKRAIHGIMLDCSKVYTTDKKTLTSSWITVTAQHLLNRLWAITKIPSYVYMNTNPIKAHAGSIPDTEMLFRFLATNGESTATFCTFGADDVPSDICKPALPYDDGKTPWYFWIYGQKNNVLLVQYNGTKTALYTELNYKSGTVTIPPDPQTPPTTGSSINVDLTEVNRKLDGITTMLSEIRSHFK